MEPIDLTGDSGDDIGPASLQMVSEPKLLRHLAKALRVGLSKQLS
jgi:hypothetical protein